MKPLTRNIFTCTAGLILMLAISGVLMELAGRSKTVKPFFGPAPPGVTLENLGAATNYLAFDREHQWKAFCLSNGSARTLFYAPTEVELHSAVGWISNSPTDISLMTRRETAGEVPPGSMEIFYACIPGSNVSWKLHVGCYEASWHDPLEKGAGEFVNKLKGLPPSNTKAWSGRRYELTSKEIAP